MNEVPDGPRKNESLQQPRRILSLKTAQVSVRIPNHENVKDIVERVADGSLYGTRPLTGLHHLSTTSLSSKCYE